MVVTYTALVYLRYQCYKISANSGSVTTSAPKSDSSSDSTSGSQSQNLPQAQPQSQSRIICSLLIVCFAPLFSVASHSGYIIIAYVSDTQHAGPTTSWYIISFFYYFISFRQLYTVFSKCEPTAWPELYLLQKLLTTSRCCVGKCKNYMKNCGKIDDTAPPLPHKIELPNKKENKSQSTSIFNLSALFIEIQLGVLLVAIEIFVIAVLVEIPVTLTAVSTDVYHLAQLAFVIITGLFTYKFFYSDDETKAFEFVKYLKDRDLKEVGLRNLDQSVE